jgi:hypothetical protein
MGNWQVHRDFYSGKGRSGTEKVQPGRERKDRIVQYSADGYEMPNLKALYPSHGHVDPNCQFKA